MGRFSTFAAAALAAAAFISTPAMAQDTGLTCMEGKYSAADYEEITTLAPGMMAGSELNQPVFDQISTFAVAPVQTCAAEAGWNEQQTVLAIFYELGRINERAFRASGALSPDELRRLDAGLAESGNEELWDVIELSVRLGMGENVQITAGDALLMGSFITGIGLDTGAAGTNTPELAGMLLGFMGLQRYGAREFAALGE